MMLQDKILQLEGKVNALKEQFKAEAVFSQSELDQRTKYATDFHPKQSLFSYPYVRQMLEGVLKKITEGWVYEPSTYSVNRRHNRDSNAITPG